MAAAMWCDLSCRCRHFWPTLSQVRAAAVLHAALLRPQEMSASSYHNAPLQLFTALQVVCKDLLTSWKYWTTYVDKWKREMKCLCESENVFRHPSVCFWHCFLSTDKADVLIVKCIPFSVCQNISFFTFAQIVYIMIVYNISRTKEMSFHWQSKSQNHS